LVEDIKANGLQEQITLYEGKILDGRNRYRACVEVGHELKLLRQIKNYDGKDPLGFVLSANLHRRHLDTSQRAVIAGELTNLEPGANQYTIGGVTIEKAGELLNVGRGSIDRARKLLKVADPQTIQEVKEGKQSVAGALEKTLEEQAPVPTTSTEGQVTTPTGTGKGKRKRKSSSTTTTTANTDEPTPLASLQSAWGVLSVKEKEKAIRWIVAKEDWRTVSAWLAEAELRIVQRELDEVDDEDEEEEELEAAE
jgi:hypothetical protein